MSPSPADLIYPPTQNGLQKTLGAQLDTGETSTCTLNNTTGLQNKKGLFVVDRIDTGGVEKDAALREYVTFDNVSGSTVTGLTRGLGGTTDQDHATGAVVEFVSDVVQQQAFIDTFLAEHGTSGVHDPNVMVKISDTQTLTNKSLTTPVIPSFYQDSGKTKLMTTPNTASDTIVTLAATQTLTNKTLTSPTLNTPKITPRVVTATDDATAVIDCDVTDQYQLTAVANATEFTLTGTPVAGQKLIVRLKDAGVAKALTWTGFTAVGVTLPTTTVANKMHYIGCIYNATATRWEAVAVVAEA
jgi:hypothetical protein